MVVLIIFFSPYRLNSDRTSKALLKTFNHFSFPQLNYLTFTIITYLTINCNLIFQLTI
jgi:hypothetical protein